MKEIEFFFKIKLKALNLNFLSDVSRILFKNYWEFFRGYKIFFQVLEENKIEKNILKVKKKINKNNIKEINEFCNITKEFF